MATEVTIRFRFSGLQDPDVELLAEELADGYPFPEILDDYEVVDFEEDV